jgi:hypothetical protein
LAVVILTAAELELASHFLIFPPKNEISMRSFHGMDIAPRTTPLDVEASLLHPRSS